MFQVNFYAGFGNGNNNLQDNLKEIEKTEEVVKIQTTICEDDFQDPDTIFLKMFKFEGIQRDLYRMNIFWFELVHSEKLIKIDGLKSAMVWLIFNLLAGLLMGMLSSDGLNPFALIGLYVLSIFFSYQTKITVRKKLWFPYKLADGSIDDYWNSKAIFDIQLKEIRERHPRRFKCIKLQSDTEKNDIHKAIFHHSSNPEPITKIHINFDQLTDEQKEKFKTEFSGIQGNNTKEKDESDK